MEINVTINAPDLSAAITNLANAISGSVAAPTTPAASQPIQSIPVQRATATQQTEASQITPTTAPVTPALQPTPTTALVTPAPQPTPTTAPVAPAPQPTQATAENAITLEALCEAGAKLVEAGQMGQVIALLGKYGVQAINQLPVEKYIEFAAEIRAIGGQI